MQTICIVCPPYILTPPYNYGGTESVIWILAQALRRAGFRIILLTPNQIKDEMVRHVQLRRVPILTDSDWNDHQAAEEYYAAAAQWIRENQDQIWRVIYHISGPYDTLLARMANQLWQEGIKGVVEVHTLPGTIVGDFKRFWPLAPANLTNWGEIQLPVVTPSQFAGHAVSVELKLRKGQVTIIPHPIPDEEFASNAVPPATPQYLAWVGRFTPFSVRDKLATQKGAEVVIQVATNLGMHAILAGPIQPGQQSVFDQIIRPNVKNVVMDWNQPVAAQLPPDPTSIYIGQIPAEQRNILLRGASCVLAPSHGGEIFGLPPIEGYRFGVPAAGYNSDGVAAAIVEGKTGFLAPVTDVDALTNAVRAALSLDRAAVLANAKKLFGAQALAREWIKLLRQI